jgi:hypothetical protein
MRILTLLILLSSCTNLKPVSQQKTSHYVYRNKHATYYATKIKCYTITIDTVKKIKNEYRKH